jgi:hypothetical protein
MANYFESFSIKLVHKGCTDSSAYNYNVDATEDDDMCISKVLGECVEKMLFSLSLDTCDSEEAAKALKAKTFLDAYTQSLKEKNSVKIEMYKEKLADLCNCKTC